MKFIGRFGALAAAGSAVALLLTGCTGGSGGTGGGGSDSGHFDGVPDSLAERLNSYAVHTSENSKLDAHFFGITGASSLSEAMEKDILKAFKSGGAFHGRRALDPALTDPEERWEAPKFIEQPGQGPTASATGQDGAGSTSQASGGATASSTSGAGKGKEQKVTAENSVVAAGGHFLVSRLSTTVGGQATQRVFVTDLEKNETQPGSALFSDAQKYGADQVGAMTVDDKALPVVDGSAVDKGDLSDLGTQVRQAMGEDLQLPSDDKSYEPDYSCGLLPCVAVTYDDGPGTPQQTKELKGYLKDANIRATFFQIGTNVKQYPKANKELLDMGNEVENHSWNHPQLSRLSGSKLAQQLDRTDKALEAAGVPKSTMLRPPYGATSAAVDKQVDKRIIQWDVDTLDWKTRSTPKTVKTGTSMSQPGSVILMHSIHEPTIKAAPQLYKNLKAKGLYPVTSGYLFKGLPFEAHGEYFCRGYRSAMCSNPEHPMVEKGKAKAKPAPED
ncbi:polysaccharide deacetylase family protein [Brevibacterium sp. 5221]|uniref:Polysaccharide deacetylase family protein n=1 Tax=Brevibacterium rongguiense TaxID=2695267 RepID=A0A6N9H7V3_9MICO|nr:MULTISPECIES: polysaccharide deacetylase family protein [Brevibacterium]MYM19975.1 polysaccharide deacetylase family protein [Brevibacterium rongguiense]WAL40058.1 polysaccharide deacetylase family protein [Brevibacterium sp. BRM-1]